MEEDPSTGAEGEQGSRARASEGEAEGVLEEATTWEVSLDVR